MKLIRVYKMRKANKVGPARWMQVGEHIYMAWVPTAPMSYERLNWLGKFWAEFPNFGLDNDT